MHLIISPPERVKPFVRKLDTTWGYYCCGWWIGHPGMDFQTVFISAQIHARRQHC